MLCNFINSFKISGDENVTLRNENEILLECPDVCKEKLGMFNYWSEKKRSNVSDDAFCTRLIVDYDDRHIKS